MKTEDAKEYLKAILEPNFKNKGFLFQKSTKDLLTFINDDNKNQQNIILHINSMVGGICKVFLNSSIRIGIVETVMQDLSKKVRLFSPVEKKSFTIGFSERSVLHPGIGTTTIPEFWNEDTIKTASVSILQQLENFGFQYFDKYSSIYNIDDEINGPNFWQFDDKKPFFLGGNFFIKRLVIAKIANRNDFEQVVHKNLENYIKLSSEEGAGVRYNANDEMDQFNFVPKYLKNINLTTAST